MLNAAKKFAAPLAAFFAAGAVVDFFKDAAQAAIDDEKSVVALSKAMDNLGLSSQNAIAESFISGIQKATGAADDELRPALQKLLTATGSLSQSQKLLNLSMDISAGTGRDLASVTQGMARASMGQFTALQRLGIPLDANILKSKDFGAATDALTAKFGGQAAAAADTYGGRLLRLSTAADEAKEAIGYALLKAVDDVTAEFGGVDSAIDSIGLAGTKLSGLVTALGGLTAELAKIKPGGDEATGSVNGFTVALGLAYAPVAAILAPLGFVTNQVADMGTEMTKAGQGSTYMGSQLSNSKRMSLLAAEGLLDVSGAAIEAGLSMDDLKDATSAFMGLISASQGLDDWKKALVDLDETLDGNVRSFKGMGDAAKENRDTLRDAIGGIPDIVQAMVDSGEISANEYEATFNRMRQSVLDGFVKNGFKASDVAKFLGKEGIWSGPIGNTVQSAATAASAAATKAGKDLGIALGQGIPLGLLSQTRPVQAAGMRLIAQAEAAMRAAAESQSPSKMTMRVGKDLGAGLVLGVAASVPEVRAAAAALIGAVADQAESMKQSAKDAYTSAASEVASFIDSTKSTILGGLNASDAYAAALDANGKFSAAKYIAGWDAQTARAEWFGNVVKAVKDPALQQMLLSLGTEKGGTLGQAWIDNGLIPYMTESVGKITTAATGLATSLVPPLMQAGYDSAAATAAAFGLNLGPGGDAHTAVMATMDQLATDAQRAVAITVTTSIAGIAAGIAGGDLPGRANGGAVLAGHAYRVGEFGEETFVPGSNGTILPHGSLDSASAVTRALAVNGTDMSALLAAFDRLQREVRDQAEKDRTLVRSNGYGR